MGKKKKEKKKKPTKGEIHSATLIVDKINKTQNATKPIKLRSRSTRKPKKLTVDAQRLDMLKSKIPQLFNRVQTICENTNCDVSIVVHDKISRSIMYYITDPKIYEYCRIGLNDGYALEYLSPNPENLHENIVRRNMSVFFGYMADAIKKTQRSGIAKFIRVVSDEFPLSPNTDNTYDAELFKHIFKKNNGNVRKPHRTDSQAHQVQSE